MEGRKEGEQRQRHRRENKRTNGKRRQWMWRLINTATVSFVRVDRLIERLDDHSIGYFLSCSVNQWLLSIPSLSKAIMEAASNLSSYLYRSQLIGLSHLQELLVSVDSSSLSLKSSQCSTSCQARCHCIHRTDAH